MSAGLLDLCVLVLLLGWVEHDVWLSAVGDFVHSILVLANRIRLFVDRPP